MNLQISEKLGTQIVSPPPGGETIERWGWAAMRTSLLFLVLCAWILPAYGIERFPPPDFGEGYVMPHPYLPAAPAAWKEWMDVAILAGALSLASWLALRKRSRKGLMLLSVFSLLYFGFYRKGCICPIGSIQDVTLALVDKTYVLPLTVILLFALPLAFAGLFGRVFCASVCPLGAVQDVVLIRGVRVPSWLGQGLRLLAYAYLGLALLYVIVDQQFMICRYDPFVSFFRLSGPSGLLKWGFFVLALSTVIGRPYCRFLCPYSVLLSLFSRWSYRHASITPDQCINCGLCERACAFDAIRRPLSGSVKPSKSIPSMLLLALPLALAGLGYGAGPFLSRPDKTVQLAGLLAAEEESGQAKASLETQVFLEQGGDVVSLVAQARDTERRFSIGACLFGMFMGTVIAWRLWRVSRRPPGQTYEIDRSDCISCGRCFDSCPRDRAKGIAG